jgi:hypothetical protein
MDELEKEGGLYRSANKGKYERAKLIDGAVTLACGCAALAAATGAAVGTFGIAPIVSGAATVGYVTSKRVFTNQTNLKKKED